MNKKKFLIVLFLCIFSFVLFGCGETEETIEYSVSLSEKDLNGYTLKVGEEVKLTTEVEPASATIIWESSDESIAKVENGVLKALKAGTVKITARVKEDQSKGVAFNVEVYETVQYNLSLGKDQQEEIRVKVDETATLALTSNGTINYKSSDDKIATVSNEGVVKGIKDGTTYITAYVEEDPTMALSIKVLVGKVDVSFDGIRYNNETLLVTPSLPLESELRYYLHYSDNTTSAYAYELSSSDIKEVSVKDDKVTLTVECMINGVAIKDTITLSLASSLTMSELKNKENGSSGVLEGIVVHSNKTESRSDLIIYDATSQETIHVLSVGSNVDALDAYKVGDKVRIPVQIVKTVNEAKEEVVYALYQGGSYTVTSILSESNDVTGFDSKKAVYGTLVSLTPSYNQEKVYSYRVSKNELDLENSTLTYVYSDGVTFSEKLAPELLTSATSDKANAMKYEISKEGQKATLYFNYQVLSISEFKKLGITTDPVEISGIVLNASFCGGTTASPSGGEIFLMDPDTKEFIGVQGFDMTSANPLAGLTIGDKIVVTVTKSNSTATITYSDASKLCGIKYESNDVLVLSQGNDALLDLTKAVSINSQAELTAFLKDGETRTANAYTLVKCTGLKFGSYNGSAYLYFEGGALADIKIDGLTPLLHIMNQKITLGDANYLTYLFGGKTGTTIKNGGDQATTPIYLAYIGGQGIYYHQFVLFGMDYIEGAKEVKSIDVTLPSKTTYLTGENFDLTGAKIDVHYGVSLNDETIDVTSDMIVSNNFDNTKTGTYTVNCSYKNKDFSFEVTVGERSVSEISIDTLPTKTTYTHRDNVTTLDLSGGKVKVTYSDSTFETRDLVATMLPESDTSWTLGEVTYTVNVEGCTCELKITYVSSAISVSTFKTYTSGKYDVEGIVMGAISSNAATELLIKDATTNDLIGIYNTGIVGSYTAPKLDTTVLNVGDKIITELEMKKSTTGGSNGKYYGNSTDFTNDFIKVSSGNSTAIDLTKVTITTISTQTELSDFVTNNANRFYSIVTIVKPKAVIYKTTAYRLFFDETISTLTGQKIGGISPVFWLSNDSCYLTNGVGTYFDNSTSTAYGTPATSEYSFTCLYVGGNAYYYTFAPLADSWITK